MAAGSLEAAVDVCGAPEAVVGSGGVPAALPRGVLRHVFVRTAGSNASARQHDWRGRGSRGDRQAAAQKLSWDAGTGGPQVRSGKTRHSKSFVFEKLLFAHFSQQKSLTSEATYCAPYFIN